jgi:adenosylmethionine-8-amino-7-oxononanoate aminotransferase
MKDSNKDWFKGGIEHIWMPYTQMKTCPEPEMVKSAEGCSIILEDGTELLDGIASWWSVCHGYQNPYILGAMQKQLTQLSHVMFAGMAHEPAYRLAKKLAEFTPKGLNKVFFADSGSTAVEIAMKMCVQYWHNKNNKRKNKFISFKDGYHGDTMGALSLGDPEGWIAKSFNNYTPRQYFLEIPRDEYSLVEFEETVKAIKDTVAGIVIEPLVQGAGGMIFHEPDILAEIHRISKENDIIFIADEIMTGFYRTGLRFACQEAGFSPDIMCVGKALTGGMVSLAATITQDYIFNEFLDDKLEKAFMHGPTFMANPLACSAALASLELFEKEDFTKKIDNIESIFLRETEIFKTHKKVKDVRVKGAIAVIEIDPEKVEGEIWDYIFELRKKFVKEKVWLRPYKNIIYLMPSFTINEKEILKLFESIKKVLS